MNGCEQSGIQAANICDELKRGLLGLVPGPTLTCPHRLNVVCFRTTDDDWLQTASN